MTLDKQVMTIAGSDSGGGAGIQADLKTFQSLGVYGTSVITGVTAQNTVTVKDAATISPELVAKQFDTVVEDMNISSIKTGMLSNSQVVSTVAEKLDNYTNSPSKPWVVIDPVLAATSGDLLLEQDAVTTLKDSLIPLCDIITPNIPEAEILTDISIDNQQDFSKAAEKLVDMGARSVLIKGGHTTGKAVDHLFIKGERYTFSADRIGVGSIHGAGCTLGAAICAYLAKTDELQDSVDLAKEYVTNTIVNSLEVGKGSKVLKH